MGPGERTIAIDRKDRIMKFVCPVCGYVEEFDGDQLPEDFKCPQCGVPGSRFLKQEEGQLEWAAEHVVGVAKMEGVSEDIVADLRANFEGECSEVGMPSKNLLRDKTNNIFEFSFFSELFCTIYFGASSG